MGKNKIFLKKTKVIEDTVDISIEAVKREK